MATKKPARVPATAASFSRRDFLALSGSGLAGLAVAPGLPRPASAATTTPAGKSAEPAAGGFPVVDIAPLASVGPGAGISFDYPDGNGPSVLLRLAGAAEGGIGPDNSIVAFSILCTHKGCPLDFVAERAMLICPCHWSSFDPGKGGRLVIGQASETLPRVRLRISDGMVQAVGMDGLIYGRHTNIL